MKAVAFILAMFVLGGCCWMSKRSCFPECPKPVTRTVTVERPCELPPALKLPAVVRTPCELPGGQALACYDKANSGLLAKRQADMKDWIREARKRCSPRPASRPTSRPVP